ncbi:tyrosine-type recombinase/integrase [Blautia producta]|uniref:tyrosine-type recombinase/integrase n=1 Tax=Blautia producta TaxID=33035 RepID=UPI0035BE7986
MFPSDLVKAGMDIKTAQYLLGHADAKTTLNVYTHFGYNDIKINNLDDYYKLLQSKCNQDKKKTPKVPEMQAFSGFYISKIT